MRTYFLARWSRLYPLFILVFAIGLARIVANAGLSQSLLRPLPLYLTYIESWWFWPVNQTYALIAYPEPAIGAMWSLSTEAFFYVAYLALVPVLSRLRPGQTLSAIALVAVISTLACLGVVFRRDDIIAWVRPFIGGVDGGDFIHWLGYNSPWIRIFEFLAGALAAQLYLLGIKLRPFHATLLTIASLAAVSLVYRVMFLSQSPIGMVDTTLLAPCIAALCLTATVQPSIISRLLACRLMVWGGEASYSLYLLHEWVLQFSVRLLRHVHHPVAVIGWALGTGAVAIVFARASYVLYERPAMLFVRNRGRELLKLRAAASTRSMAGHSQEPGNTAPFTQPEGNPQLHIEG
jgi:peptidoglycan/LPS O-acetylase OafA/YrhL